MVTFNSVNESDYTYSRAACCGGVNQPLGAVCVEGLMESDSKKHLSENTVSLSFYSANIVAKVGG